MLASSLLCFNSVMKGAVGEAFMGVFAAIAKYQASNKDIVAAYGRLYQLLMTAGYDSWQDYLLDQLLLGRDNPLARAAAQGGLEEGAPVLKAAAFDLDVLQELCIDLQELAQYVGEVAPTAGPYWVEAASSASTKRPPAKELAGGGAAPTVAIDLTQRFKYIQAPPSTDELAQWKAAIASHQEWGKAVPLVQQYFHTYGFGITSRNAALRWSKGAFEEASEGSYVHDMPLVSSNASQRAALAANTLRHAQGHPAQHALVCGPPGSGKSFLLWEATLAAGRSHGIRVVDVPASEFHNILDVARGCARYPRVRFVLVADHVELPLRGQVAADLAGGLSGHGGSSWPSNTILYLGASSSSTVNASDANKFGLVVATEDLRPIVIESSSQERMERNPAAEGCNEREEAWLEALAELSGKSKPTGAAAEAALAWARKHGFTLQTASQYSRFWRDA